MNDQVAIYKARSLYYGLISHFFVFNTADNRFEKVQGVLEILKENPIDENSYEAAQNLLNFLSKEGVEGLSSEYDEIFHNPITANVPLNASHYDEGIQSGKKRLAVIQLLAKTKIRRNEKEFKDYEDTMGFIATFMHELLELMIEGQKSYECLHRALFTEIINDFADELIFCLYEHESAKAYKDVAVLFNSFLEFERMYFGVSKPQAKEEQKPVVSCEPEISEEEAERRRRNKAAKAKGPKNESCEVFVTYDVEDDI